MCAQSGPPPSGAPKKYHNILNAGSRPYRSHKVRACDFCRKRKSRCIVDLPGQPCFLCRMHGGDCHHGTESESSGSSKPTDPGVAATTHTAQQQQWTSGNNDSNFSRKRKHDQQSSFLQDNGSRPHDERETHRTASPAGNHHPRERRQPEKNLPGLKESYNESVQIVGPVAAEDAQVIEQLMPLRRTVNSQGVRNPYNVYSNDPRKPILYTTVSRRRHGLRTTATPGENQQEILEQVVGSFRDDLVKIFMETINASFPLFDESSFLELYESGDKSLPPALLCQVYAMSLIYWKRYPILAPHPRPDIRYAVNLAVAALHEEFSAPGLSTLSAALIDLTGRPIFSMTGNAISSGRTVALSHCLGLNRDPSNWKLSTQEKNQRIRLWWGVVIHDRWASYGHGVPPQVARHQYDVPIPTTDVLVPKDNPSPQRIKTARCFIALCQLTEILGDLLPLVYNLQPKTQTETAAVIQKVKTEIDVWEKSLPAWLRRPQTTMTPVSGSSSLHLALLSLKMLVRRVELQETSHPDSPYDPESRRYFQTECRSAAEEIVRFIASLKKPHFEEFWMPYGSYQLTTTATLLVRCALETSDTDVARSCMANVDILRDALQRASLEHEWEVADMCLDHCERILSKYPGPSTEDGPAPEQNGEQSTSDAWPLPDTLMDSNVNMDEMMPLSGTFGHMDGFPFDMTGIWDIPGLEDGSFV